MPQQAELFGDRYAPFEHGLPDDYPRHAFKTLHPAFTRRGEVIAGTTTRRKYYVDLALNECNCDNGWAWKRNELGRGKKDWYEPAMCGHKLRMMSRICEETLLEGDEKRALMTAYLKALGTRYNPFEVVSAFHKELRRGDFTHAWFWGLVLTTKRGLRKCFEYLLNIIYEETRDHDLAYFLLKCRSSERMLTLSNYGKAISWFCATPKKWELPRRFAIFEAEMRGYKLLVRDYGRDVAKGANIIPADNKAKLLKHMQDGARKSDLVQFQRGLKGLQKLQYLDDAGAELTKMDRDGRELQKHRYWLYNELYDLAETVCGDTHDVWRVVQFVNDRIAAGLGIGYHELNAIADALTGEPADAGLMPPIDHKRAIARPTPAVPLYRWPKIPLYASDNHTYEGKRLLKRFPDQLKPKAKQTDLDFRYCGAYFGVAYRMVCHNQHGDVNGIEWHQVDWPLDMYNTTQLLWY